MGRSQVERNRTRGRPGQGRGGRGGEGGRGRGRGGGGGRSSSRRKGPDPRTLGDNAFRYERGAKGGDDATGDSYYDGLLDDINFLPSGGLGEYYGDAHSAAEREGEDLAEAALSAASGGADGAGEREAEDWMSIDVKALDKCLRQIPIHERLKLPRHIGRHLEEQYGLDGGGAGRKKTLAELREESKIATRADDRQRKDVLEESEPEKADSNESQPDTTSKKEDADEDEEDLDAWLDDMIA